MAFTPSLMSGAGGTPDVLASKQRGGGLSEANDDDGLVVRSKDGDETAFAEIVRRYRRRLFAVAFSRIRNRDDAEEIVQDTFVCAHRGLATFRGECSLATWLHHVTLNLARNRYRYFQRRFRHATVSLDCPLSDGDTATLLDGVACGCAGPRRDVVTREFMVLIGECMQQLDEPQRRVLTLTHTLTYAQIARELGINVGTVKSRIARARDQLHAVLCAACPEFANDARPGAWLESIRSPPGRDGIPNIR